MKPLTDEEYKELKLKYRIRALRNNRTSEILEFAKSDAMYAELQRYLPTAKIKQEQKSYLTTVWHLRKSKELTSDNISIHVCGDRIVAEKY